MLRKFNNLFIFFVLSTSTVLVFYFLSLYKIRNVNFIKESSVWCSDSPRICKFKNVCFCLKFKTLLFFLVNNSIIKGMASYKEFQNIQLSSLKEHNQFYANISIVDPNKFVMTSSVQVIPKIIVFSRFKPDNIMHVFHDDLFPLFLTLESVCLSDESCIQSFRLVMHDVLPKGPFFDLYKSYLNSPPILLGEWDHASDHYLCFKEMLAGLIHDSILYQYGYKKPHGPVKAVRLTQNDVSRFTSFVKKRLKLTARENEKVDIVVISRKKNRKILNINDLIDIVKVTSQKIINKNIQNVKIFDLHTNNIQSIIKAVSEATILVGMHGAEMIFSLFMKPNSIVIEIFPFGIQPDFVSFVKPLSEIDGSYLYYIPWRNLHKNKSVPHPNAHPMLGGITHLSRSLQEKIMNANEVHPVKCCNDPLYLYHIYQDTWVTDDFKNFLYESMTYYMTHIQSNINPNIKWFYPYKVFNISCEFYLDNKLVVRWFPPFNMQNFYDLKYNLYLKDKNNKFTKEFWTSELSQNLELPKGINSDIQGWIFAVYDINDFKSRDSYFECRR